MFSPAEIKKEYDRWCAHELKDAELKEELLSIKDKTEEISDCFYRSLEFGTGGLRGVIGAGTNRMNVYTVAQATQGLANYLKQGCAAPIAAIAYDSRIKSRLFAETAAAVLSAAGVKAFIFTELMPTPALSFAVRSLGASAGIVITASHNPSKYNGYKVYGQDGCQITLEAAAKVLSEIERTDVFCGAAEADFAAELERGGIEYIPESVTDAYIAAVSAQSLQGDMDKDVSIVYTPLNGAGLKCVTRALRENGFTNISVVPEQEQPDGHFPTCPYPNPEMREALERGLAYAKEKHSDLLIATDPDCDRMGIAVRDGEDYVLMTGNQVGALLLDYIAKSRTELLRMPAHPVAVKTIVTTELAAGIAKKYGVELIDVLTGFKFIGEQIGILEQKGCEDSFIFGFEESYGCLTGSYVRDKDGVGAALMVCEMFAWYRSFGLSLMDALGLLYEEHGCYVNDLISFAFEGAEGFITMGGIMEGMRRQPLAKAAKRPLYSVSDYKSSRTVFADGQARDIQLPVSDVLRLEYEGGIAVVVRPSGTEPKLKLYFSVREKDEDAARQLAGELKKEFTAEVNRLSEA